LKTSFLRALSRKVQAQQEALFTRFCTDIAQQKAGGICAAGCNTRVEKVN
jgi:hypothetical protein